MMMGIMRPRDKERGEYEETYVTISLIICTVHQILLCSSSQGWLEMGEEKSIQNICPLS